MSTNEDVSDASDPEVDIREELFSGIASGPLEQYEGLLEDIEDVNVSLKQRTLLHVAVKLGKVDWVEGLLVKGADPSVTDGNDVSALHLADEMRSKHPDEKDFMVIQKLVHLIHKRGSTKHRPSSVGTISPTADLNIFTLGMKDPYIQETKKMYPELSQEMTLLKDAISQLTLLFSSEFMTINKTVDSLISQMSDHQEKMALITEAMCDFRKDLASRDILLESLEGSVTSLVENLNPLSDGKKDSGKRADSADTLDSFHRSEEKLFKDCVSGMMSKTRIFNTDERKMFSVKGFYEKLYHRSELTSCLLKFIKCQPSVTILVDCDSINIGRMKTSFRDHNGVDRKGNSTFSWVDFTDSKVYLGGKVDALYREEHVIGWLAKSLTELSMYLAFGNAGEPYLKDDGYRKQQYEEIVAEAEERYQKRLSLDSYIFCALRYYKTPQAKKIELMAAVPRIIAYYGGNDGISRLRHQLPSLIDFYEEHVMATLLSKEVLSGGL